MDKILGTEEDLLKIVDRPSEVSTKCVGICTDLANHKTNVLAIVEALGPLLTSPDVTRRRCAVVLLTEILNQLPKDFLPVDQLKCLLVFYLDRLRDHHSLLPAILAGVTALSQMAHCPEEELLQVLFTIIGGSVITCQSQQRDDRSRIFDLILWCSAHYHKSLLPRSSDFIQGVINAVEGERDPRNLMKLFTQMPALFSKYPLEHWADEAFEVFACYYPIDFYSSAQDSTAITRDLLAEKLNSCLVACPEFVEPAIVLALEKLESKLVVAKTDSLVLIGECAKRFGGDALEARFDAIWMGLKDELLPGGQNEDVIRLALRAIDVIVANTKEDRNRASILDVIFNTIAISLCDSNLRLFGPAVKIATAIAGSCAPGATYTINKVCPILWRQYRDANDEQRAVVLKILTDLMRIGNEKGVIGAVDAELFKSVEHTFVACLASKREITLGYQGLIAIVQRVSIDNRLKVYAHLLGSLTNVGDSPPYTRECMREFGLNFEPEVMQHIINPIIERRELLVISKNAEKIFQAFCTILDISADTSNPIYNCIVAYIFSSPAVSLNLADDKEDDEQSVVLGLLLKTLNSLLTSTKNQTIGKTLCATHNIPDRVILSREHYRGSLILGEVSQLTKLLMRHMDAGHQKAVIDKFIPTLDVCVGTNVYFIVGLLANCDNALNLEEHYEGIVQSLIKYSLTAANVKQIDICDQLLCFLVNRNYPTQFEQVLSNGLATVIANIDSNGNGIRTLGWLAKGMLCKGHPSTDHVILKLIAYLKDPTLARSAAVAFELLAKPVTIYLPNVRLFHKQKLFDLMLKHLLVESVQLDATQMRAIAVVLGELPSALLKMHLPKVGPIIFQSLDSNDATTISVALAILQGLTRSKDAFCQSHLQFLVPTLSKLSAFAGNMNIRIAALECLFNVTQYDTYLLLPFKQDVVLSLQPVLDDHKRLVRSAAVKTRTQWFLIDALAKSNT